jgi:RNA polymerase sigma factor (sigma-70 family)
MEQTQKIYLYDALDSLKQKEQSILKLYYFAGFTEEELAESYHISHQRIHQIKERALQKCKLKLQEKLLSVSIV